MTTTTFTPAATPSGAPNVSGGAAARIRRIVVATGGDPTCQAALRAAHDIATRHGAHVTVVSVFQPRYPYPTPSADREHPVISPSDRDPARRQLAAVRQQLALPGLGAEQWSLAFVAGQPAYNITRLAKDEHADLVIIGLGRENAAERGLGDRGSMATAANVQGPLLAVSSSYGGETRDVMVAVGSDTSAAGAVQVAQEAFPAPERLYLVHVDDPTSRVREATTRRNLDAVRGALTSWGTARVETWVTRGEAIDQLLSFAQEHEVDLVVGGLHGRTFHERAIMHNAALWLMAIGDRSVLLVPPQEQASS